MACVAPARDQGRRRRSAIAALVRRSEDALQALAIPLTAETIVKLAHDSQAKFKTIPLSNLHLLIR